MSGQLGERDGEPFQDATPADAHYGEDYFEWQEPIGALAEANAWMFREFVRPTDLVVDFGCGGGFLLQRLEAGRKIGIEVNPAAVARARASGLEIASDLGELPARSADVVISNHALEHTFDPFDKLRLAHRALKRDGLAVFVVPCERYDTRYEQGNIDQHTSTHGRPSTSAISSPSRALRCCRASGSPTAFRHVQRSCNVSSVGGSFTPRAARMPICVQA